MKGLVSEDGCIGVLTNKKWKKAFCEIKCINKLFRRKTLAKVTLTQNLLIDLVKLLSDVNPYNHVIELSIKRGENQKTNYLCIENDAGELFFLAGRVDKLKRRDKVKSK